MMAVIEATTGTDAVLWEAPAFGAAPPPAVADLERIERMAREEGHASGRAEGLAQGQTEVRRLVAHLEGLIDAFAKPLAELDAEIESALAALAVEIAGALVRAEYVADAEKLAALVREAVAGAGDTTRAAEIRLHPDDVTLLRPLLSDLSRITADHTLSRGDVRVHADTVRIDARLSTRLASVLENLAAAA